MKGGVNLSCTASPFGDTQGIPPSGKSYCSQFLPNLPHDPPAFNKGKRALDLFSGTGSVGTELENQGFEVTSIDIDPQASPVGNLLCEDILTWYYKAYPRGYFSVKVAGPPCTVYSCAYHPRPRDFETYDQMVVKALAMVKSVRPDKWWIENPRLGYLRTRTFMHGLDFFDLDVAN